MTIRDRILLPLISLVVALSGCNGVDDDRIPNMPVNINLSDPGVWSKYGVFGFGDARYFVPALGEPKGFFYSAESATGFGGVLLIRGMDPVSAETDMALAYDLACPVECDPNIRVRVDASTFEAICPVCGSHYDVTMAGGSPVSGPALTGSTKLGLRRYSCYQSVYGGYLIR